MTHHIRVGSFVAFLAAVCLLPSSLLSATITLSSPSDYQVFQRQTRTQGEMRIAGKADVDGDLQYRIIGKPLDDKLSDAWQSLPMNAQTHAFDVKKPLPAGGWYSMEFRVVRDNKTVAEASVDHVGMGEVFVIAGQSNSANSGEQRQKPATNRVVSFDGSRWVIANDPQPGASGDGGSFSPAFGDAMVRFYKVPVGVACVGVGGTSVREWLPKGDAVTIEPTTGMNVVKTGPNAWECTGGLFHGLVDRMQKLGPQGFRAVLWHQGESDAKQAEGHNISPEQYRKYLVRVIEASRAAAGWKMPWFVALASYHTPADTGTPELRAAQKSLSTDGISLEGPNTDTLGAEFRDLNGQGVHLNARGLQRHGELWATSVRCWLDRLFASERWERDIRRYEAADKVNPPPKNAVLFIGSSGIVLWKTLATDFPEYQTINRGFGGSEIADSVFYYDRLVTPHQPRLIVLRAGVNDLAAGKTPDQVFEDFKAFVALTHNRLPNTRIAFLALNPSLLRWGNFAKETKANELIKAYIANDKMVDYVDIATPMLGSDGKPRPELYAPDRLHNSPEGYKLWAALVRPYLVEKK